MTEATAAAPKARRSNGVFRAHITPTQITGGIAKNDKPFATMRGAKVELTGKEPVTRTVMAFGDQLAAVNDLLAVGQTVELAVRYDGGTLAVVGLPRAKAEPAAEAA